MNKRIEELAEQSKVYITGFPILDEQKFAELIVRECVNRLAEDFIPEDEIIEGYNDTWDSALRFGAQAIKQHFGVEE